MTYKTEICSIYNDDDFVQNGTHLNELTVTITLCEYRNLIKEAAQNEAAIISLQEKLKRAEETVSNLSKLYPGILDDAVDYMNTVMGKNTCPDETAP